MHRKEHTFNNKQMLFGCFTLATSPGSEELILQLSTPHVASLW